MSTAGKQMFHTFKEAAEAGPYDEMPMLPRGVDPQLHLSRNDRPQPFHLVCEKDCVLVLMSGRAKVHFADGPVRYHNTVPGDFVYVPAGMAHRIVPEELCVQYRYKAAAAGLEGAAFLCGNCGRELYRPVWDTAAILSQAAYADACETFDGDAQLRRCDACGEANEPVGFDTSRWRQIAADMKNGGA